MKKNESGRSMVEMLGVLAIIGVLSIGGIAGYTLAMNRYRANEILDTAAKVAVIAMSKNAGNGADADYTELGITSLVGATNITANSTGVVTVQGITSDAVANLVQELGGNNRVTVSGNSATIEFK